jgi:DNA-binding transcriptional regulator LsrR (DeoR family)
MEMGYPNEEELNSILSNDAAGDIFAHFFDHEGSPIVSEFDKRLLALSLKDSVKSPYVLLPAAGRRNRSDPLSPSR